MVKRTLLAFIAITGSLYAAAQQPQPQPAAPTFNYKKFPSGLQYAFIIDKPTSGKPEEGGQVSLNMQSV